MISQYLTQFEPYSILIILFFTMVLFIWGKFRYDIVALLALMTAIAVKAVPYDIAYSGLSNAAVITVACVMIISKTIADSGILSPVINSIAKFTKYPVIHVGILTAITAILSAFMNNVGALGLMMPVAIQSAIDTKRSPSMFLMPIALGSAMGGLTTVIGTPPNLLISTFRAEIPGKTPFAMFDFSYCGFWLAFMGVIFISFIGWRLIPRRKKIASAEDIFQVEDYITELKIIEKSKCVNVTVKEFEAMLDEDYVVLGIIRNERKRLVVRPQQQIVQDDILIVQATSEVIEMLIQKIKLEIQHNQKITADQLKADDIIISECVVPQASTIEGRTSAQLRLRSRFQTNLLAISRQGKPFKERLTHVKLTAGDVILLQGPSMAVQESVNRLGLLPLLERNISLGKKKSTYLPMVIFTIAIIMSALHLLPVQIAFGGVVLALLLFKMVPARKVYDMIEWPIIILLAAMIPIGRALETTGGAQIITNHFIALSNHISPTAILVLLMFVTMTLSDFMNNAATAVLMAPIAVSIAQTLHLNVDSFLMAVAISASCSFLTPVGHQNNTLVMGPGGYKFSDYIRIGLPLEILVLGASAPLLLHFFPIQ